MEDAKIIELLWHRSEEGLSELSKKYGKTLFRVAENILGSRSDAEECVNDAYLACWNTIPPENPKELLAYACRIVRNVSLSRHRKNAAKKRRGTGYDRALDELESSLASDESVEAALSGDELSRCINAFLGRLDESTRVMFVRRYYYSDSVSDIAKAMRMSGRAVSVRLFRVREKLREYLKKEGYLK